jgi:uncharacterized protein (UPF0332 family)
MTAPARAAQLIDGANKAIVAAQQDLETGELAGASERACVAMLRLAKACLAVDGLTPGPTSAVCVAYADRFAQGGRMYSAYHRWLLDAADLRKAAGTPFAAPIDRAAVETAVERAEIFRDAAGRFVAKFGNPS